MPIPQFPFPGRKSQGKKPVPKWQSWERTALDRKFRIVSGIIVIVAVSTIVVTIVVARRVLGERSRVLEKRPTLVNSRAPVPEPFVCDLKTGFYSGGAHTFINNVGDARADNVLPTLVLHVVPERKVGIPEFDDVPKGDCSVRPQTGPLAVTLAPGQEASPLLPPGRMALPPLLKGETAQLYGVSCAYYSDSSGADHAMCDTYRFRLASGTPVFRCDGVQKSGTFSGPVSGSCAN